MFYITAIVYLLRVVWGPAVYFCTLKLCYNILKPRFFSPCKLHGGGDWKKKTSPMFHLVGVDAQ